MMENILRDAVGQIRLDDAARDAICRGVSARIGHREFPYRLIFACAAVLVIGIFIVAAHFSPETPSFVLLARASDEAGEPLYAELKFGERVRLYDGPIENYFWEMPPTGLENHEEYALDVTCGSDYIAENYYIFLAVVDENGEYVYDRRFLGENGELCRWSYSIGDDVRFISPTIDGSVEGYRTGEWEPMLHGKYIVWIPNDEGNSYTRIRYYNADLEPVTTLLVHMVRDEDGCWAELISQEYHNGPLNER